MALRRPELLARTEKIGQTIAEALQRKSLSPQAAGKLAGKVGFLARSLMGRVSRAATKALFERQYAKRGGAGLTRGLEDSLRALQLLVGMAIPRTLPIQPAWRQTPLVYADAYVKLNGTAYSLAQMKEDPQKFEDVVEAQENGIWGGDIPHGWTQAAVLQVRSAQTDTEGVRKGLPVHLHP